MDDATAGQVTQDAAELYEQFFVPALFGQWPHRLLDTSGVVRGDVVLDVGCGTGVLARAAHDRVGPVGRVTGVDVNPGMLAVAARTDPGVRWLEAPAESLPLEDASTDVVLSQFAAMFFTDRAAAIAEMGRVTRPGGRVVVATWAGLPHTPGYAAMVALVRDVVGEHAAAALEAPFVLGRPDDLAGTMAPTFGEVEVHRLAGQARFPSVRAWVDTDVLAWTLRDLVDTESLTALRAAAETRLARFRDESGAVRFAAPALVALAVR